MSGAMQRDSSGENWNSACGVETHDIVIGQRTEFMGGDDDCVVLMDDGSTSNANELVDDPNVGDRSDIGESTGLHRE
jgi:hypothetical protein